MYIYIYIYCLRSLAPLCHAKATLTCLRRSRQRLPTLKKTLNGLVAEARKYEEEKQAPKGRPKHLATEAKQAVEECDKICKLVGDLIEE